MWEFLNTDRWITLGKAPRGRCDIMVPLRRTPKDEAMMPKIVEMAEAGSGIDLISRALGIGPEVVRDPLHLHQTGKRPPGRVDGRRRQRRQPGQRFEPKYRQIAAEVDRRRKAGEGFDRLAREMHVSRGTVLRAYDFANRDDDAAPALIPAGLSAMQSRYLGMPRYRPRELRRRPRPAGSQILYRGI